MVNSQDNNLDALKAALSKGVLDGLKKVTSPDVAYVAPAPDATGMAEAALAYLNDAPAKATRPEKLISTADAEAIAAEVTAACLAAGVPLAEINKILTKVMSNVGAPKTHIDEVRKEAMADVGVAAAAAAGNVTEASQSLEELKAKIKQLDKVIDEALDSLEQYMTPEERERLRRLRQEREEKTAAAEQVVNDPTATPEQKQAALAKQREAEQAENTATTQITQRIEKDNPTVPAVQTAANTAQTAADDREQTQQQAYEEARRQKQAVESKKIASTDTAIDQIALAKDTPANALNAGTPDAPKPDLASMTITIAPLAETVKEPEPAATQAAKPLAFAVQDVKVEQSAQLDKPVTVASAQPDKSSNLTLS